MYDILQSPRAGMLQNWKIKPEVYQQTKFCRNEFIVSTHITMYEIQQLCDAQEMTPTVCTLTI